MSKELERGKLLGHVGCPKHGSTDSLALYQKSDHIDSTCWSECGYISAEELKELGVTDGKNEVLVDFAVKASGQDFIFTDDIRERVEKVAEDYPNIRGWKDRKIKTSTCERYGVRTKMVGEQSDKNYEVELRFYPSTENGELVGYHVRNDPIKQARKKDKSIKKYPFFPIGKVAVQCDLFGMSLFNKGGKFVVLTEGEEDALAVFQCLQKDGYETPCVSPTVGSRGAIPQIKHKTNYEFLKSFEHIILFSDDDDAGNEFVKEVTKIFGAGKVLVTDLAAKDACDALQKNNGVKLIRDAFWNAVPKKPSQVLTVDDIYERALKLPEMGLSFPWDSATKATLGIRPGEIHIIGAAPKIGKTEHQHQLTKHLTEAHNEVIGMMSLEENPTKTLKKIAGKYAKKQFTKPPEVGNYTQQDLRDAMDLLRGKIEFYSTDGVRDYEEILSVSRYWASKGILKQIIDPLTAIVAEYSSSQANDILNSFMSKAASMAMELGITYFMYSHVNPVKSGIPHDQGGDVLSSQFTGSRAMEKWAHYGWGIQRNRTEKDPVIRNTARITMLFDREYGEYCEYFAYYDSENNDWSEVAPPENADDDDFPYIENDVTLDDELLYEPKEQESTEWEVVDD